MKKALVVVLLLAAALPAAGQSPAPPSTPSPVPVLSSGKAGFGIDGVTSPNILFRYYFTDRLACEVTAGFGYEQPSGAPSAGQVEVNGMEFRGGFGVLYHLTGGPLTPYVGGAGFIRSEQQAGFYTQKPDPKLSVQAGFLFGADYFFERWFSLGVKQFLGADFRLSRDVPDEESTIAAGAETWFTARYFFD